MSTYLQKYNKVIETFNEMTLFTVDDDIKDVADIYDAFWKYSHFDCDPTKPNYGYMDSFSSLEGDGLFRMLIEEITAIAILAYCSVDNIDIKKNGQNEIIDFLPLPDAQKNELKQNIGSDTNTLFTAVKQAYIASHETFSIKNRIKKEELKNSHNYLLSLISP